ncbi:hypothetical protein [Roseateles koreensis]|uniref:Uncharacterized protein n=1 Tax=Roseateles koreensis TaxID=2987526 RepID=A0ABT5KT20_9BURK|nr:hypothetical protein [Roseateles koreensis]MDC8786088.1 hypothetical protein [Roseateles koreensis]
MNISPQNRRSARRACLLRIASLALLPALQACKPGQAPNNPGTLGIPFKQGDKMKVALDVVTIDYYKRPFFELTINGIEVGLGGHLKPRTTPVSGFGVITAVPITLGPQTITWRLDGPEGMARNGETVQCKNTPQLDKIPAGHQILIIYLYPDDTVDLQTSTGGVYDSARGLEILEENRRGQ